MGRGRFEILVCASLLFRFGNNSAGNRICVEPLHGMNLGLEFPQSLLHVIRGMRKYQADCGSKFPESNLKTPERLRLGLFREPRTVMRNILVIMGNQFSFSLRKY